MNFELFHGFGCHGASKDFAVSTFTARRVGVSTEITGERSWLKTIFPAGS